MREDLPRAKVEQELEALRYQSYVQQQLVQFATFQDCRDFFTRDVIALSPLTHSFFLFFLQREERDALVARQVALSLEREERQRERELQEMMRLQLRLGDEAMQREFEKRMQEEKDEVTMIFCD